MHTKNYFAKQTPREQISQAIKKEGFDPILIKDKPGFVYEPHQHPEAKLIVCLEGSMKVKIKNKELDFEPGDKIIIPGNTLHSAVVGKSGCLFYWSEKIINNQPAS